MHTADRLRALRILAALVSTAVMGSSATGGMDAPRKPVEFVGPVETVSSDGGSTGLASQLAELAKIDPAHPLVGGRNGQTLSMFGREDLIAGTSDDYTPARCSALFPAIDVFQEIERRARTTSIVIVNESHERSQHRGFTAQLAARLRPLGYDILAMEALSNNPPGTPTQYAPTFVRQPTLPYFVDGDGHYLSEAGFGRLGRSVKALGYRLLPYESVGGPATSGMTRGQQIAIREESQARTLATFVRDHPGAKLLVQVGYSHAAEVPQENDERWMAARLKDKTGIDPLTISQTTCRGGGGTTRLAALPTDEPAGSFDLIIDHPDARFVRGRPEWRQRAGDRPTDIPQSLRPAAGWRVVEARPVDEPTMSVPMDRVAIRPGEDVALMLPPGRYQLRIIDPAVAGVSPKPAS